MAKAPPPAGYSFKLDTSIAALKSKLKELGHGQWQDRESNTYGDYIFGTLWGVTMRIFDGQGMQSELGTYDPKGHMLLDYARAERGKPIDEAHHTKIVETLFPALGISKWTPDEGND